MKREITMLLVLTLSHSRTTKEAQERELVVYLWLGKSRGWSGGKKKPLGWSPREKGVDEMYVQNRGSSSCFPLLYN